MHVSHQTFLVIWQGGLTEQKEKHLGKKLISENIGLLRMREKADVAMMVI